MARLPEGVFLRHQRDCATRDGGRCSCDPSYQAQVYDRVTRRRKVRTFPTTTAAKIWRQDTMAAMRRGTFQIGRAVTVRTAGNELLEGMRAGLVRNRSGDPYKPSVIRSYEQVLELRIYPTVGPVLLSDLRRSDVQRLVGQWLRDGHSPSTIRNTLMPLRVIYRRAIAMDEVAVNPVSGVELPAVRGKRDRFTPPAEAELLIGTVPEEDEPLWSTAFYTGLRLGELQALYWERLDFKTNVVQVRLGYDRKAGEFVEPKSAAGVRDVPIPGKLRPVLLAHRLRQGRGGRGLVFGRDVDKPFADQSFTDRAARYWTEAGLDPLTLHDCRHSYASMMIAAGVNPKALCEFMGHSSIVITLDRYGHLFPGAAGEAAQLLDDYLEAEEVAGG